jgi:hypothetical protein
MDYNRKKYKSDVDPLQKMVKESTAPSFPDKRASTTVQLKQQQIMHGSKSKNLIYQLTEKEKPLQGELKNNTPTQLLESTATKTNKTGLPDNLKSGIESLSGYSMDDVKVHFNSDRPVQLNAHAYAQGTDIHVAPGQEQHLPHEAWHVVQQKQGRVQPTMQMKAGVPVNNDAGLENEADVMGAKAASLPTQTIQKRTDYSIVGDHPFSSHQLNQNQLAQLKTVTVGSGNKKTTVDWDTGNLNGSSDTVGMRMQAQNLIYENVDEGELVGSTPRTSAQKDLMGMMPTQPSLRSTDKFIKGHLLNHNIGGPGLDFNMFPITGSANGAHSRFVESTVKKWVSKDKVAVDYLVQVDVKKDESAKGAKKGYVNAAFMCRAKNLSTDETIQRDIDSIFNSKAVVTEASSYEIEDDDSYSFDDGTWFSDCYNKIAAEEDSDKVEQYIDQFSDVVGKEFFKNYYINSNYKNAVDEIIGVKTKRFTQQRQETTQDIVKEALLIFCLFNDKTAIAEYKNDYPTLVTILNSKK